MYKCQQYAKQGDIQIEKQTMTKKELAERIIVDFTAVFIIWTGHS